MIEEHMHGEDGSVIVVQEETPEQLAAEAAVEIARIEAEKEVQLAEIYAGSQEQALEADVIETEMEVEAEFDARSEVAALRDELRMALDELRAERESQQESVVVLAGESSEAIDEPELRNEPPKSSKKSSAWW